jgi:putative oxygen-independent coproporphyrinogen III oxidase
MSSLYVHVPFCASRCGYCDFNTYTATEIGDDVRRETFHEHLCSEIRLAAQENPGPIDTVFVGGGTPTLLGAEALNVILDEIRTSFGLSLEAEVTTEANPDSVNQNMLAALREGGFTRMSFGMQSTSSDVLRILDRTHTPGMSVQAARWAREVGFEHVNVDLIYGTPGETHDDVRRSVDAALSAGIDHLSAYALIVEDGTMLGRRVSKGEMPMPDDDLCADRYELIDDALSAAGMTWYEISNWSMPGAQCRHNQAYWQHRNWWGVGPGAHSHRSGTRWWNVKHPATYAGRLLHGESPQDDYEVLTPQQQRTERILLGIRTSEGLPAAEWDSGALGQLRADGLVEGTDRIVLTRPGRLLADAVTRALVDTVA